MGFEKRFVSLLAIGALAIAAGCSGGASQVPSVMQSAYSKMQPAFPPPASCPSSGLLMFVSDSTGNVVNIFSGNSVCHKITGLSVPQGLAYSQSLNRLYVANSGTSEIYIYQPPFTTILKKLEDPGEFPTGIALCKGYTAVTSLLDDTIAIYKGTGTMPSATLTEPNAEFMFFDGCDGSGNLFATYADNDNVGRVDEFLLGQGSPVEKSISLKQPGGIEWLNGTLMVLDQQARTVRSFHAPYNTAFKTLKLTKALNPVTFAVTPNDQNLQTADSAGANSQKYHLSGGFIGSVTVGGQPIGVTFNQKP
jgi:DNA-binding beta-propeller fold protein YncE